MKLTTGDRQHNRQGRGDRVERCGTNNLQCQKDGQNALFLVKNLVNLSLVNRNKIISINHDSSNLQHMLIHSIHR